MRIYNRDLRKARRWLASGRTTKVIRFLEPKVPLFLEDPDYYGILGRACLESGLINDADTYLNRGLQADPNHLDVRLALAATHLKRKDPSSAVRAWLEVLEDHPDERHAAKGLKALKRIADPESQDRFLERFDPNRFLPNISPKWPSRVLISLIVILLVLMGFYFRGEIGDFAQSFGAPKSRRPGAENLANIGRNLVDADEDVRYPMTDAEAARTLKKALRHFEDYEDNSARYELNKIVYSNVKEDVRNQARLMIGGLGEADIETIETNFSYSDVEEKPWLYEGCWVLWSGATANVAFDADAIAFDFLVGFHQGEILEGRVGVRVPFLAVMEPLPLELLAKVELTDDGFVLVAKTLHFLR